MTVFVIAENDIRVEATLAAWLLPISEAVNTQVSHAAAAPRPIGRHEASQWRSVTEALRRTAVAAALAALRAAFPDELVNVVANAVATHEGLKSSARSTMLDPSLVADVLVGHFPVRVTYPADVDLRASFASLSMPFQLIADLLFADVRVHLVRGRITRVSLEDLSMDGYVTAYDEKVYSRHGVLHTGGTVVLESPVRVLDRDEEQALSQRSPT